MTRNDGRSSINTTCSIIVVVSNDKCRYSLRCFPFGRSCLPFSFSWSVVVVVVVLIYGRGINKWWNIPTTTSSCGCCGCHSSFSVECCSEKDRDVGEKNYQKSWPYLGYVHSVPKKSVRDTVENVGVGKSEKKFLVVGIFAIKENFCNCNSKTNIIINNATRSYQITLFSPVRSKKTTTVSYNHHNDTTSKKIGCQYYDE